MRIRELRRASGLSQTDVAKCLNLSQCTVAQWERGQNVPSARVLPALADMFDCSIDDLFGRKPPGDTGEAS
ncbi:MAG: helix-turn-helix transcriptional regulator [Pseudoflavonifractor sp.]